MSHVVTELRAQVATLTSQLDFMRKACEIARAELARVATLTAAESDLLAELDATKSMCTQNGRERDTARALNDTWAESAASHLAECDALRDQLARKDVECKALVFRLEALGEDGVDG